MQHCLIALPLECMNMTVHSTERQFVRTFEVKACITAGIIWCNWVRA